MVLSEIPIRNHLRPGEAVYEPFSGSGTTLMAAETLGRHCYAMEIDPKYVQVAIERWQNFTWRQAERADCYGDRASRDARAGSARARRP